MLVSTFYSINALSQDVPSESPVDMEQETITKDLLRHLKTDGDFIGVIDSYGTTLQVMCEGEELFWLEIPHKKSGGSFGQKTTRAELINVFQNIPKKITNSFLVNGNFISWG